MRRFSLPLLLVVEVAALAPLSGVRFGAWDDFLTSFGWYAHDLLIQAAPILILSLGMTAVLMSGGIDLSIGSMTALVACVMSTFEPGGRFWVTAVPLGLAAGAGLGLINGLFVAALDVPPIIATLGTLFFYRGLCDAVMRGAERGPFLNVPGYERLGDLDGSLLLVGCVLAAGGAWFRRSRWRREILMIGGNRVAARYAAIVVPRRLVELYTLCGVLAFFAAICFTAHNGSASASSQMGLELEVIVAVVLGGTSVTGGRGSLAGSIVGVFLVAVLSEGLRAGSAVFWIQDKLPFKFSNLSFVLLGVLLAGGVWIHRHVTRPADGGER